MRFKRAPELTSYGLVIPPSAEDLEYLRLFQAPTKLPEWASRHHLYWPRKYYASEGELAKKFREHPFASIWITDVDHGNIHHAFDGVPTPRPGIMKAFLAEAELLEGLGVSVRAVEMIDAAIYEGRILDCNVARTEDERQCHLDTIQAGLELVENDIKVIPISLARLAIEHFLGPLELAKAG